MTDSRIKDHLRNDTVFSPLRNNLGEAHGGSMILRSRLSSSLPVTRRSSAHKREEPDTDAGMVDGHFENHLQSMLANNYSRRFDSDSEEEEAEGSHPLTRGSWRLPNRYVSQEELKALEGCVTRRRALFSPSPASSPQTACVSSSKITHCQVSSPMHCHSQPLSRRGILGSSGGHSRQGSLEYDHLTDFNPHVGMTDSSVSIQFRLQGDGITGGQATSNSFQVASNHSGMKCRSTVSSSIPEMHCHDQLCHGSRNQFFQGSGGLGRSNSSCVPFIYPHHAVDSCSGPEICCDPAATAVPPTFDGCQPTAARVLSGLSKPDPVPEAYHPSPSSLNAMQHQSPYHTKFNSPLLSKHQYVHEEDGVMNVLSVGEHTGSNFSLYSQTTTVSSLNDRPHCSYSKGVDGSVFKDRTDMVLKWFTEFSDQQRNMMLLSLLEHCDCAQMHFLSVRMEPVLHDGCPHNCQDLLSWLPFDVITHIFSFLDPVSLCIASMVNKDWYHASIQPKLWEKFCSMEEWKTSLSGDLKFLARFTSCDGSIKWKAMFGEKYRLRRNWLKGYFNVRTFEGHTQGISCIQFDDTRIVSGSWDKTIKVWNRRTNTVWAALTLAGHSGTVRCLHLHNNRLVSGSSDRTLKVWDLATDKVDWVGATCRATMVGHMHTVRCLQADDDKVISGSYDQTLKVWNIRTGQCKQTLRGHTDAVLCLQFDKEKVVSGSKDKTIKIWSLPDGVCKLTIHGHQAAVSCLHFDETRIISGALDRLIKIWDMVNGECIRCIDWIKSEGHTGVVRHLQADSWKIISAADDKTLKVWNVHTGNRLLTLKSHTDGVTCLQFNDEVIVSGSYDKTVKLWDFSVC